jgi:hypothetical protein
VTDTQILSDETLFRVIHESGDVNWSFFALKVMISRLKLKLSMTDNSEKALEECYTDLRQLFHRSHNIPNAIKDLQIIMNNMGKGDNKLMINY